MRYLIFLLILILCSCEPEEEILLDDTDITTDSEEEILPDVTDIPCSEEDCVILNPFGFSISPAKETLTLNYGQYIIVDGPGKTCLPDALDFYLSENNEDFTKVERVEPIGGSIAIEDLEDGKEYYVKMVNLHCELDSQIAPVQSIVAGEIPQPQLISSAGLNFEDFRLASDGNRFIYRSHANDWYLSSLNALQSGNKIINGAFHAQWNPNSNSKISFVQQTSVDILTNLQGITSKSLMTLDLDSNTETNLHEIEHLHDFNHEEHNPEQYWIHEFHYSLDGTAIYFISNKDNGSSDYIEKQVFNNIWKLDLQSKSLEVLSNFLPIEFEMLDFTEDPKQHGNFYLLGKTVGEKIEEVAIYYFDSAGKTISPIFVGDHEKKHLSINPIGDRLIFVSNKTGREDIWRYHLSTQQLKQITNSVSYYSTSRWNYVNWISDNEFMTYVKHNGEFKFASFNIE